ncbi:MAG: cysteine desulfurase family protein [Thermoanaerobaculia bacterium]
MIYLDNNASTKLDPEVRETMERALDLFGNPSSVHGEGRAARRAVEQARDEVASLVAARPEEIVFTSGGTEANALAIFSAASAGGRIVETAVEHPSVRAAVERLGVTSGVTVVAVEPLPDGTLTAERLLEAVVDGTLLVCVMAASNEYGGLFPVEAVSRGAGKRGALVHTDAVQAAGRVPIDVGRWEVDTLALSAHKLHGPKGVGALYVRRGLALAPLAPGGGQEKRRRAGTENVPGIAGFGAAARLALRRLPVEAGAVAARRDALESGLLREIAGARVIGAGGPRLPNTSAMLFEDLPGETLLMRLDLDGLAVSVGSACSSGTISPSPALTALGLTASQAKSVVRFSLSRLTTDEEIEGAVAIVSRAVSQMRARRDVA